MSRCRRRSRRAEGRTQSIAGAHRDDSGIGSRAMGGSRRLTACLSRISPRRRPMRIIAMAALMLAAALPMPARAADLPLEGKVTPVEVVKTGDYSEGVVVDHDGNLY